MLNIISIDCQTPLADSPAKVLYMEKFKERMKRIRARAGFKSQGAAAEAIGCERGTVGMWEAPSSAVQQVSSEWLFATARAYKVRPDWINNLRSKDDGFPWDEAGDENGHVSNKAANAGSEIPHGYLRFQLLEGAAGMGDGVENEDYPEVIREVDIAGWEVRRKLGFTPQPGRVKLLTGRGPSMRPMIDNGDVVMVDTSVESFDGDAVYVINVGGETQIKMLQMRGDGLYVVSANADYPAYRIERDGVFVGGKVVSVMGIKPV